MTTHRLHQIRVALQEKRNRVRDVPWKLSGNELRFFCAYVCSTPPLSQVIEGLQMLQLSPSREQWSSDLQKVANPYKSERERAAYYWFFLNLACKDERLAVNSIYAAKLVDRSIEGAVRAIWECFVDPFWRYLDDQLDHGTVPLDLLERYVRRVEMFTGKALFERYKADLAHSEDILTDDLKLYLFDGGIDYPISPKATSGIADIGAKLESNDAILVEVKIVDPDRKYGKDRVLDGIRQIAAYARNYNKSMAYLVMFIVGNVRVVFTDAKENSWPPAIVHDGRKYFLVTVHLWGETPTASRSSPATELPITNEELSGAIASPTVQS